MFTRCEVDDIHKAVGFILERFCFKVLAGDRGLTLLRVHDGLVFVERHVAE